MILLVLSSFLYGLNHSLGAIMVKNEDSLQFSFQFLIALVVIQLPLVLWKYKDVITACRGHFHLLVISGFIGSFLYWCEFSSLQVGLPISHITLLMLTVPAWVLLYELFRGRGGRSHFNKWMWALIGSFVLIQPEANGAFKFGYFLPIMTSLLTAAWLINSKKGEEAKIHPMVYSFFNDLISLIGVTCYMVYAGRGGTMALPANMPSISLYALIVGVMPNLLLFYGLRSNGIVKASTIIMLEPVISGVLAYLIHHEVVGINFFIGGAFIMLSHTPVHTLVHVRDRLILAGIYLIPK